jgi:hypothetical protein
MLLLTLLFGAGAAAVRGFQLTNSFDPQTALIEPGDPYTIFLMVLSAVFTVLAAAYLCMRVRNNPAAITEKRLGGVWFSVQFAALALLFASSVIDTFNGLEGVSWGELFTGNSGVRWGVVCFGFLGLFSTGALLMVALTINKRPSGTAPGFWATVPVFWACLMLVTDFWGQAGSPVRNAFVYGMLGSVFCAIALYTVAGFFFGRVKPASGLFYAFSGIFFSALTLGGALLAPWLGETMYPLSLTEMLRFGFIILHLSAVSAAIQSGKFAPNRGLEYDMIETGQ